MIFILRDLCLDLLLEVNVKVGSSYFLSSESAYFIIICGTCGFKYCLILMLKFILVFNFGVSLDVGASYNLVECIPAYFTQSTTQSVKVYFMLLTLN